MTDCDLQIDFPGIRLTSFTLTPQLAVAALVSTASEAHCPCCQAPSGRIHSHYVRTLADLPGHDRCVAFRLTARRFRCRQPDCPQAVFCERLPNFVEPYARTTARLTDAHHLLGLALGGEPGSRLAEHLSMPTSGDTLLRRVKAAGDEPAPPPRFVGIDDWAFRKGQRYGTIVVDLERGRVIDLLPDREAATVEKWLKEHPGVEVITRDRAAAYAKGATDGAPQAQQVADRWHLLKNLREAVERLFARVVGSVPETLPLAAPPLAPSPPAEPAPVPTAVPAADPVPAEPTPAPPTASAPSEPLGAAAPRADLLARIQELHRQGHSIRQIAATLQLARNTVRRYLRTGRTPTRQRGARPSRILAPQREWLNAQIDAGTTSAPQLHRGLIERGVRVSVATVRRYVTQRLTQSGKSRSRARAAKPAAVPVVTPRQLSFQWVQHPGEREADVIARLKGLRETYAALEEGLKLADEFARLIRKQTEQTLAQWLADVAASTCPELRGFAAGLEQDLAAVRAALETQWSNGPVEGQVNRLKMLKRQMYGRAGLHLLRKRVTAA